MREPRINTSMPDRPDRNYLVETLSHLARVPTDVPLGFQTFMEPDDPKLVHYVQSIVRLGIYDVLDVPRNNLVVRYGAGESWRALLIQNYTPAQHNNTPQNRWMSTPGSDVPMPSLVLRGGIFLFTVPIDTTPKSIQDSPPRTDERDSRTGWKGSLGKGVVWRRTAME